VSPRAHEIVSWAALTVLTLIVMTGAGVRLTGSGLGCPQWPRCNSDSITPTDGHAFIEFGNRMVTTPTALFCGLALVFALLRVPYRPDFTRLGAALVAGVFAQAILGGITVLTGLNPVIVSGHFLLSMVTLTLAVMLVWRIGRERAGLQRQALRDARLVIAVRATVVLGAAVVFLGTMVTASGPHAGGEGTEDDVQRLSIFGSSTFRDLIAVHARIAAIFGIALVVLFLWVLRRREGPTLLVPLGISAILTGTAGLIGHLQYHVYAYPAELVWVHVCLIALLWSALSWAAIAAGRAIEVSASEAPALPVEIRS
jgi:cytochrome c oxidase assembly protein subunit 15